MEEATENLEKVTEFVDESETEISSTVDSSVLSDLKKPKEPSSSALTNKVNASNVVKLHKPDIDFLLTQFEISEDHARKLLTQGNLHQAIHTLLHS